MRNFERINEIRNANGTIARFEVQFDNGDKVIYASSQPIERTGNLGDVPVRVNEHYTANGFTVMVQVVFENDEVAIFIAPKCFERRGNL